MATVAEELRAEVAKVKGERDAMLALLREAPGTRVIQDEKFRRWRVKVNRYLDGLVTP